jgi:L-ascorbate metabolism protein UlaG (beta-lactamase superfamily)
VTLRLRRLSWAGLEIAFGDDVLLIDPLVELDAVLRIVLAGADEPLVAPSSQGTACGVLVSHLHRDHADADAIRGALLPGGRLLGPPAGLDDAFARTAIAGVERELGDAGLTLESTDPWESAQVGPFEVTAVPASDGTGDPQVSWVVSGGGRRILHGGDTLWHGAWWKIAARLGPIDVAFLPINGAVISFPWTQPAAEAPAAMTPEQAVEAARALGAPLLIPIHYGLLHHPDLYREHEDPSAAVVAAGARRDVEVAVLEPGGRLALD